jgi:hypothetical protein
VEPSRAATATSTGAAPLRDQGDRIVASIPGQPDFELRADSRGDHYPYHFTALVTLQLAVDRVDGLVRRQSGGALEGHRAGPKRE